MRITTLFNTALNAHSAKTDVVAFADYQFLSWHIRSPLDIQNILGIKFIRSFHNVLLATIHDIKSSDDIDKSKLHAALLMKYFNVDIDHLVPNATIDIQSISPCNAYLSTPDANDIGYFLHWNFLEPYRLFGITPENRKFFAHDTTTFREWRWHASFPNSDSAPFLRYIIQIYILDEILQYYESDQDFKDEKIKTYLPILKDLREQLFSTIDQQLTTLLQTISNTDHVENNDNPILGDPRGLEPPNGLRRTLIENIFPDFLDISSFYPIGRLIFGQPRVELHHEMIMSELGTNQSKIKTIFFYLVHWLFTHLNLSTSLFWIKTSLYQIQQLWHVFKNYVTQRDFSFEAVLNNSLRVIPTLLILAATPLLILAPPIYGLTSIPFTLLRSLCLYGPFKQIRNYRILKVLDIIELIKDIVLFIIYALPLLDLLLADVCLLIPAPLLAIGTFVSFIALILLSNANDDPTIIFQLASTPYFSLVGFSIVFGMGLYLFSAKLAQFVYHTIPDPLSNLMNTLISPFLWCFNRIGNTVTFIFKNRNQENNPFKGYEKTVDSLLLPYLKHSNIPIQIQEEAQRLSQALGQLNQSFNFSAEREQITACIKKLAITAETTPTTLEQAIKEAQDLLANRFNAEEAELMKALLNKLKEEDAENGELAREISGILQQGKRDQYQPSWAVLKMLRAKNIIQDDGRWAWELPDPPSPEMQAKCRRIEARAAML